MKKSAEEIIKLDKIIKEDINFYLEIHLILNNLIDNYEKRKIAGNKENAMRLLNQQKDCWFSFENYLLYKQLI